MAHKHKFFFLPLFVASSLFSAENSDLSDMQKHYYERGYEDASEKFYKAGYEKAIADMLKRVEKYRNQIDAMEAGKYLSESGKITYPKVYRQQLPGGGYNIHIDPPQVQQKLSLEDIFIIPAVGSTMEMMKTEEETKKPAKNKSSGEPTQSSISNSFVLPAPTNTPSVSTSNAQYKEIAIKFPKTEKIKRAIDSNQMRYAEMPDAFKVYFSNTDDYENFCTRTTGEPSCDSLYR